MAYATCMGFPTQPCERSSEELVAHKVLHAMPLAGFRQYLIEVIIHDLMYNLVEVFTLVKVQNA